jgi:hypothetical protein
MADYIEDFEALTIGDEITLDGWSQAGDAHWKVNGDHYNGGSKALKGTCLNNQHAIVRLTKTMAAGNISFYWYTSAAISDYALLMFRIDGVLKNYIYGDPWPWSQEVYAVSAGEHTLEWDFYRFPTGMGGANAGWIDDIVVPLAPVSITGTMNLTEESDSCSIAGLLASTGIMPVTEENDSSSITGSFPFIGIMPISEGTDIGRIYANLGTLGTISGIESADLSGIILYHLWPSVRGIPEYIIYRVTLSQSGLSDYVIPVSYWSCSKQSIGLNYFNCIVPDAYSHEAAIVARATGNLAISKGEVYADGSVNWATIMSVPLQQISVGYGEADATITLGGNSQKLTTVPKTVALSGVSYRSETNGSVRLRAEVDLFAEVGDTITYGTDSFIASSITYSVATNGQAIMEVAA